MKTSEFKDLQKLACTRAREAVLLVDQLIDEPDESAAMFISVALHLMEGASVYLQEEHDITEQEAMARVVSMILASLGMDKAILSALGRMRNPSCGD